MTCTVFYSTSIAC